MKKKQDFGTKPYNRCLSCPHRQIRCDGPRTSAMELTRWREFMRDMKELNGLTNAEVAERAKVSVKTVEQLLSTASYDQDIMRETARRIEDAIIGSSNQYPCILAFEESVPKERQEMDAALKQALADNKDYRTALDNIHASYNAEMQIIRDEAQRKIDFLLEQLEHLREENAYLRKDNNRRGAIIDKYISTLPSKEEK